MRCKAIVSSDWNECLAPCGPFDFITYKSPELGPELAAIFRQYTGHGITLGEAVKQVRRLLSEPVLPEQMDAYLDDTFITYPGVARLIDWCLGNDILFMINTTGVMGYFQRIFAKGLLPRIPAIAAHPLVRFPASSSDPRFIFDLLETGDKGKYSAAVIRSLGISPAKIILIGDSGGDGPHFKWGSRAGAYLIGSMTKTTLEEYCRQKKIKIDLRFGVDYSKEVSRNQQKEMQVNFMDLAPVIESIVND